MKANELTLGDWVCYSKANNYYTRVNEIRHTEAPLDDQWYIEGMRSDNDKINPNAVEYFAVEILSPIPLTAEILEKNFNSKELPDDPYGAYFFGGNDYIEVYIKEYTDGLWQVSVDEVEMGGLPSWRMFVSNVHELQHALRFCLIDKEIGL